VLLCRVVAQSYDGDGAHVGVRTDYTDALSGSEHRR
jgi:hypothetical protein